MKEISVYQFFNNVRTVKSYEAAFKDTSPFSDAVIMKIQEATGKAVPFSNGFLVDLGCGPGTSINSLQVLGFKKFFAADIAPEMIKATAQNFCIPGGTLRTELLNVETEPITVGDSEADMVSLMATTQYVGKLDMVFQEAHRVIKPKHFFTLNLTVHNNNDKRYRFLDDDFVPMYVHPISYIQQLIRKNAFKVSFEGGFDSGISWVPGIDMKEYFLLLQKL